MRYRMACHGIMTHYALRVPREQCPAWTRVWLVTTKVHAKHLQQTCMTLCEARTIRLLAQMCPPLYAPFFHTQRCSLHSAGTPQVPCRKAASSR
jgi:hypothetical protein